MDELEIEIEAVDTLGDIPTEEQQEPEEDTEESR